MMSYHKEYYLINMLLS